MKSSLKVPLLFSISILLIFLSLQSFAQPRGMTMNQVYKQIDKQTMNQQMDFMGRMQLMNMRGVVGGPQEFDFQVVMLDSTKKQITSAVYTDTVTKKHFIVWIDKRYKRSDTNRYKKIYPTQTRNLTCVLIARSDDGDEPGSYLPGKITDSCWMFKIIAGRVSAYSYTIQNDTSPLDPSIIVGIQLDNGPILPFNQQNLKAMVVLDPRALELASERKYVRAIKRYNNDSDNNNLIKK